MGIWVLFLRNGVGLLVRAMAVGIWCRREREGESFCCGLYSRGRWNDECEGTGDLKTHAPTSTCL